MFGPLHKSATLLAACIILLIAIRHVTVFSMTMVTVSLVPRQLTWWEGLVKLLRRMTSGRCLAAWHFRSLPRNAVGTLQHLAHNNQKIDIKQSW